MFGDIHLPEGTRIALANISNHAITRKTWSTYRTAERMLQACRTYTGLAMDLPISHESTLVFLDWLIRVRKVKTGTINSYLAGIRQLHIIKGLAPPELRTAQVKLVLKGQGNIEATAKRTNTHRGRLPVTLALMKILKDRIRQQAWKADKKLLTWAVCTIAFHGGFRIHELLAQRESTFDPDFTLLGGDARVRTCTVGVTNVEGIEFKLKNPKESRAGATVIVDVFATGGHTCPVKAFKKWKRLTDDAPDKPLFRDTAGRPLTGSKLNKMLRKLLAHIIDYRKGSISTHSFRSGLASLMAEKGMTDTEIQTMGRWSSRAFEKYIKLPRTARAMTAMRLGKL
jgi:integrase